MRSLLAVMAAMLLLTACGTTEPPAAPTPQEPSAGAAAPITVTDARGKQVTLDRPATRVVGLEWGEVEMLVALGVQPVGAADVKGYGTWVTAAPLDASVKDVGTRQEPSVDSVAALQPDLVVMESDDSALIGQLEKIAPVIVAKGSDAAANLTRMRDDLTLLATAVGRTEQAARVMADFDAAMAAGRAKIAASGSAGQKFMMADGWKDGSKISIRPFGKGALVSDVAERLGLTNAWTGQVDAQWGLGSTDVEGMTAVKDENLRLFYNASDGVDVFAGLAGNSLWKSLSFVKRNQITKLPDGIWTFGGPLSCRQFADALVKAYAG
ncbi:iron-siderophore ABC transporter substrate-binding protein [Nonomuraea sp. NPDC049637]|uniref:iron-siderophore ABC transporter substrate-binding protein n=1 Tax=Nonomuraea sp. NPDC049637 TaxID=3154356 RepID=UPI00344AB776